MALNDYDGEIVLRGTWLYGGTSPTLVLVIARNFDASYDPDDEDYPDQTPVPVGPDGRLYSVSFPSGPSSGWVAYQTIEALKAWADSQPWGPVKWDDES